MVVDIAPSWKQRLEKEVLKSNFQSLMTFVEEEYKNKTVYPPKQQIFNAFKHCSFEDVKVVIIGQDPYHGSGQANGLCFSVQDDIKKPPSLLNIFKEIKNDLGKDIPVSGNLERWACQGVLLLNATLTVQAKAAGSHQNIGWEGFTDAVIKTISNEKERVVFLLWGAYAQRKCAAIDEDKHYILKAAHPSPFAAYKGFFGCKHFSKTNKLLLQNGLKEIDW